MPPPRYFHQLSKEEFKALSVPGYTYGDLMRDFRQPDWCLYPEALEGSLGCWSLIRQMVWGEGFCIFCDCYKQREMVARQVQFDPECWLGPDNAFLNEFAIEKFKYDDLHGTHFIID